MRAIGSSHQRLDARGKVTGETQFPGDINYPDQLHAKILFARRPHARITRLRCLNTLSTIVQSG